MDVSVTRIGVREPAQIIRDKDGIPHIFAESEADLMFMQGFAHARDRLFQMDMTRRQSEGTLTELLGRSVLPSDIQLRTFGMRRAAEASVPMLSVETRKMMEMYAAGVNAWIASNPLPAEYQTLEITQIRPWSVADSLSILKLIAFQLAFDLNDLDQSMRLETAIDAGNREGFDGEALFLEDFARVAPFDQATTIPDSQQRPRPGHHHGWCSQHGHGRRYHHVAMRLARELKDAIKNAPYAEDATRTTGDERGSNAFVVSGRHTKSGEPLLAGDPHLGLNTPSIFHEIQLEAPSAGIDVMGMSLPGVPYVIFGQTKRIAWTGTNNDLDQTDVFQEQVVRDASSPSGLSTTYRGNREHVISIPERFRANQIGDSASDNLVDLSGPGVPTQTLIVPRRNRGPLLRMDNETGVALSAQYVGTSGTRDMESFRRMARARKMSDFTKALEDFDSGSQNILYTDVDGNIAYFMTGELPLREDLQAGNVAGASPMFIRDGQGGNEWIPARSNAPDRALGFEILPLSEMPRVVNPPRGFLVTANNDPTGATLDNDAFNQRRRNGGILYFGAYFSDGVRAGRIDDLLADKLKRGGRVDADDLQDIQADTVMLDARVFTPWIIQAFNNARRPGANATLARAASDRRVIEAAGRLAAWDQSTPTGIKQGFDANDRPGKLSNPSNTEIRHSIATTIYSVWRNQFIGRVIRDNLDRVGVVFINTGRRELLSATRNLFDKWNQNRGVGESGFDFFAYDGIRDAATRRDLIIIESLAAALDLLSGDAYADAFNYSTRQDDYRWGILHRVVLTHPLGAPFSIHPQLEPIGNNLPGIPVDGGLLTVDVANNTILQDAPSAFEVRAAAVRRYIAQVRRHGKGFDSQVSFPGGVSGVRGDKFSKNILETWLTNEMIPLRQGRQELFGHASSSELYLPLQSNHRSMQAGTDLGSDFSGPQSSSADSYSGDVTGEGLVDA